MFPCRNFPFGYVIEEIFYCPDVVVARDRNSTATRAIESTGKIVNSDVDVAEPGRRLNSRIEANLAGHPLWLLLAVHGKSTAQKNVDKNPNWKTNISKHCVLSPRQGFVAQ